MSAASGIPASPELIAAFGDASASQAIRFLKVSIKNETLVPDDSIPASGTLDEDLDTLGDALEDNVPAYVLVRLDNPPTEWLAIFYVPDGAKVRDKMLYASTRSSLTRALGATAFSDSFFANSKSDLTAAAYARHRASQAAPKPLSEREKEIEEIKAAELRETENGGGYQGSSARVSHVATVGMQWSEEVEQAVRELFTAEHTGDEGTLILVNIDTSETLVLTSTERAAPDELGSKLPPSDPVYAFYLWPLPTPHVLLIYSCPYTSPIKPRMLYSSASNGVFQTLRTLSQSVESSSVRLISRRLETSEPRELTARYLEQEFGELVKQSTAGDEGAGSGTATPVQQEEKRFAKPRGPARRAR